ncbi:MAG: D-alanine--D-alanine ligase family protein [Atopobiaceae bacterium]
MSSTDVTRYKVALLAGGWSDEREISFESAHAVEKALHEAGFEQVDLLDVADDSFITTFSQGHYDVAFIAMHGQYGEDGCIQGLCEIMHIPYTFSGVLASAMATDKDVAKEIFDAAGIPTPAGVIFRGSEEIQETQLDEVVENLGLPLIVKPVSNGSSFGVTRVTERSQLKQAIAEASVKGDDALVEQCIEGTEITVPVLGNNDGQALPVVEIVTGAEFYSLKVKYEPSALHHIIPARLDSGVYAKAQKYAVMAHQALGCKGCSRSDFIVTKDGTPVILETNTIPGMTEASLLPDSARHGGIEFPELCKRFIEYAVNEHNTK